MKLLQLVKLRGDDKLQYGKSTTLAFQDGIQTKELHLFSISISQPVVRRPPFCARLSQSPRHCGKWPAAQNLMKAKT